MQILMKRISKITNNFGRQLNFYFPFSDKSVCRDKMNLTVNGEHAKTDMRTKDVLNSLFSNIVDYLKILQLWKIQL